jgi:lysophospholipase L1-like esterase
MWREFCARNCKKFIDLFPAFKAEQEAHADWYERLFIPGDFHYSAEGHRVMFRELAKELL